MIWHVINRSGSRSALLATAERSLALLDVALTPGGISALFKQRPLSLSAFELTSRLHRLGIMPSTILDVGANQGQFTAAALYQWPFARVHAFEPLPDESASLKAHFEHLNNVEIHSVTDGGRDGTVIMHRYTHSFSSSLLPPTSEAKIRFVLAVENDDIEVS